MAHKTKTGFYRSHPRVVFDNLAIDAKTGELVPMPSMTKQSFVEQCDINNLLKQFKVREMLQTLSVQAAGGRYVELPDELDFQNALHLVMDAQTAFATLPSKLRNRFDNNPAEFLAFMADPRNEAEIYELGLAVKPAAQGPAEPSGREAPPTPPSDPPAT